MIGRKVTYFVRPENINTIGPEKRGYYQPGIRRSNVKQSIEFSAKRVPIDPIGSHNRLPDTRDNDTRVVHISNRGRSVRKMVTGEESCGGYVIKNTKSKLQTPMKQQPKSDSRQIQNSQNPPYPTVDNRLLLGIGGRPLSLHVQKLASNSPVIEIHKPSKLQTQASPVKISVAPTPPRNCNKLAVQSEKPLKLSDSFCVPAPAPTTPIVSASQMIAPLPPPSPIVPKAIPPSEQLASSTLVESSGQLPPIEGQQSKKKKLTRHKKYVEFLKTQEKLPADFDCWGLVGDIPKITAKSWVSFK